MGSFGCWAKVGLGSGGWEQAVEEWPPAPHRKHSRDVAENFVVGMKSGLRMEVVRAVGGDGGPTNR